MQAYQREISRELSSFLLLSLSSSSDWSAQQPEGTDTSQNLCRLSINLTPSLDSPSSQMGCCSSAATYVLAWTVVSLCCVRWVSYKISCSQNVFLQPTTAPAVPMVMSPLVKANFISSIEPSSFPNRSLAVSISHQPARRVLTIHYKYFRKSNTRELLTSLS